MARKSVIACLVLLIVVLLLGSILFLATRPVPRAITVRHVGSFQSDNRTEMTFEIKNHSADSYIFFPFEVQIRSGNAWSMFQRWSDISTIHPAPKIDPNGVASYTVNVTNLPAGSRVRFSIRPQKILLGVNGFVRRAELNLTKQGGGSGGGISLNPYDRNSKVFGVSTEVVSGEFVEPKTKQSGQDNSDQ